MIKITVAGPQGAGKTTIAKLIAEVLETHNAGRLPNGSPTRIRLEDTGECPVGSDNPTVLIVTKEEDPT